MNGTKFVVESTKNKILFLQIPTARQKEAKLNLLRICCGPGDDSLPVLGFRRLQFRLAELKDNLLKKSWESIFPKTALLVVSCTYHC